TVSTEEDAKATTMILMMMLNSAAHNIAGPEAEMNSLERALLEPAFTRILMRGGQASERLTSIIDPMALVVGMVMWGARVMGIRTNKLALAKRGYEVPTAPPSEPSN